MESPSMLASTTNAAGSSPVLPLFQRYYFLLKGHYFLFFSAFGMLYPILSIILRGRGLSNTEISYISLIIPFLVFFTNPLMGFLADHSRRYLLTFNLILAVSTISYILMFILPSIKTHNIQSGIYHDKQLGPVLDFCASQEAATTCASRSTCGCSYQANCRKDEVPFNFTFTMSSTDTRQKSNSLLGISETATCGIEYRVPIEKYIKNLSSDLFLNIQGESAMSTCEITCSTAHYCHGMRYPQQARYVLLYSLLFVIGTNLLSNTITLGASIGFAALTRPELFGQQRVWGTIGFGISAFAASRLYDVFKTDFVYIIMFSITTMLCILVTSFIRTQPNKQKRSTTSEDEINSDQMMDDFAEKNTTKETTRGEKKKNTSQSKIAALIPLLKKVDVIVFLSLTFVWGTSYGALDPYLYLYIDEIAPCQSRSIVGWMSLISASSEVIALFLAGRMLKLLGTNLSSITILLAFAIRFSGYYFIRRPYFLLFMESMHYFNFGILYVLIAQKADAIAPTGLSGTLQGVVYGLLFGLGRGIGLIVASFIYTRLQSRLLFLFFAVYNIVAALFYGLYFLMSKQRSQKSMRSNTITNVPRIVIESDTNINEEPLLIPSSVN